MITRKSVHTEAVDKYINEPFLRNILNNSEYFRKKNRNELYSAPKSEENKQYDAVGKYYNVEFKTLVSQSYAALKKLEWKRYFPSKEYYDLTVFIRQTSNKTDDFIVDLQEKAENEGFTALKKDIKSLIKNLTCKDNKDNYKNLLLLSFEEYRTDATEEIEELLEKLQKELISKLLFIRKKHSVNSDLYLGTFINSDLYILKCSASSEIVHVEKNGMEIFFEKTLIGKLLMYVGSGL